tara:strand:+ start:6444 stop:7358 length:915 start_codon:yes stop_codon:yes gene_type:complete
MKVCVTGASGYLGQYLVEELVRNNHIVLAISRSKPLKETINYNFERIDLCDTKNIYRVLQSFRPNLVIHCAAAIPYCNTREEQIRSNRENLLATKTLLSALTSSKTLNCIFISTISVYANKKRSDSSNLISETDLVKPEDFYGVHKLGAEELCKEWLSRDSSRSLYILRLSGVHGGDRRSGAIFSFISKALLSESISIPSPYSRFSFLHISDAVRAILLIVNSKRLNSMQILNIAGAEDIELVELAEKIIYLLDSKSIIKKGNIEPSFWSMSSIKAQRVIGYIPTPLNIWLKNEIKYLSQQVEK